MKEAEVPPFTSSRIRGLRGTRNPVDPSKPYAFLSEVERTRKGTAEAVNTIFLTGKECSFTCLMCDLWKNTTDVTVPPGAIQAQIRYALDRLPPARHIKLYNSSNFFDPGAVPPADYPAIAELVGSIETVIVENHPLLTGERCLEFAHLLKPRLQVAMGLETIHPGGLQQLNKKMVPEDFRKAVVFLREHHISSRAFILLRPPFLTEEEGIRWAKATVEYAFDSGVDCCTIIPTRAGNGAMESLQHDGHFSPPRLHSLEQLLAFGINLGRGNVFADSWDLEQFSTCPHCFRDRKKRIIRMNLEQTIPPNVRCNCSSSPGAL